MRIGETGNITGIQTWEEKKLQLSRKIVVLIVKKHQKKDADERAFTQRKSIGIIEKSRTSWKRRKMYIIFVMFS